MDKICIRHLEFPCLHNNFFSLGLHKMAKIPLLAPWLHIVETLNVWRHRRSSEQRWQRDSRESRARLKSARALEQELAGAQRFAALSKNKRRLCSGILWWNIYTFWIRIPFPDDWCTERCIFASTFQIMRARLAILSIYYPNVFQETSKYDLAQLAQRSLQARL